MKILLCLILAVCISNSTPCPVKQYPLYSESRGDRQLLGALATDCTTMWFKLYGEDVVEVLTVDRMVPNREGCSYMVSNWHCDGWVIVYDKMVVIALYVDKAGSYDRVYYINQKSL